MTGTAIKVLLIEDNPGDVRLIREELLDAGSAEAFDLTWAGSLSDGLARLATQDFDVVLLDLVLPESQGLETFLCVQERAPHVPVLVLGGLGDDVVVLRAVGRGAQDYLIKGQADGHHITRSIRRSVVRSPRAA